MFADSRQNALGWSSNMHLSQINIQKKNIVVKIIII